MNVGAPLLRERPRLIAIAVGGPVLEAAILWAVGLDSALGIAPQATAPAPFDAIAGLFNAWAWLAIVHVIASRPAPRFIPLAPAGLAAFLVVVVGGAALGFETVAGRSRLNHAGRTAAAAPETGKPVLVVSGFGTHWDGDPHHWLPGPYEERRFSYRGLGPDQLPAAYSEADTHRSLRDLARLMPAQAEPFH